MSFGGSISNWIEEVKAGCESAATMLWRRYNQPLRSVAGRKLVRRARAVCDEDDVVLDAFHSFLRRCRNGEYPELRDRHDLWRLLMAITIHKANNEARNHRRLRRDARRTSPDESGQPNSEVYALEHLVSPEPPSDLVAMVSDSLSQLFSRISDGELRSTVLYRLDGYSISEIAKKLGRSKATIERRMRLIREIWRQEFDQ